MEQKQLKEALKLISVAIENLAFECECLSREQTGNMEVVKTSIKFLNKIIENKNFGCKKPEIEWVNGTIRVCIKCGKNAI